MPLVCGPGQPFDTLGGRADGRRGRLYLSRFLRPVPDAVDPGGMTLGRRSAMTDNGRLCHGAGGHEGSGRCRRGASVGFLRVPASDHPSRAPRPDWIGSAARRTPSCWCREVAFVLIGPVRRSIDGGGLSSPSMSLTRAGSLDPARRTLMCTVASAPAAFRVRVWHLSRVKGAQGGVDRRPRVANVLANVSYPPTSFTA
jgi:hypothetical protein